MSLTEVEISPGEKNEQCYIILLNQGVQRHRHLEDLNQKFTLGDEITHDDWNPEVLNGYSAKLSPATLDYLRASPDVKSIAEDAVDTHQNEEDHDDVNEEDYGRLKSEETRPGETKSGEEEPYEGRATQPKVRHVQTNAPWGLARIIRGSKLPDTDEDKANHRYQYEPDGGEGVDVYVLDSGIRCDHEEFEGRARWGATLIKDSSNVSATEDKHGHGTHVAATIGGAQFGVAKKCNLIAVKILKDDIWASGSASDAISGLNWVLSEVLNKPETPAVVNMSASWPYVQATGIVIESLINALAGVNVPVVVTAGNNAYNANNRTPARVASAITVGSTNIRDAALSDSNYGPAVNLFAPGGRVMSADNKSTTAMKSRSGTSMAAPHVTGIVALRLWQHKKMGTSLVGTMQENIINDASYGKVTNINEKPGSPNRLARTEFEV